MAGIINMAHLDGETAVHKFPLTAGAVDGTYWASTPRGAVVLSCSFQKSSFGNGFMLWALVDPKEAFMERKTVFIAETGRTMPKEGALRLLERIEVRDMIFHAFIFETSFG